MSDERHARKMPVRISLRRRPRPQRTFEERAAMRMPRAVGALRRLIFRLPPGSHFRRAALARAMQLAFASYERGDFEMVPRVFYAQAATLETARGRRGEVPLDLPSPVQGVEGVMRWLEIWHEPFSSVRYELGQLYDGGDSALLVMDQVATGRTSGAEVRQRSYSALRWERGQVVWQFVTLQLEDAMEAAGFDALPEP